MTVRSCWVVGAIAIGVAGLLSGCAGSHGSGAFSSEPQPIKASPAIPDTLIGLDAQQLAALFGPAAFRRSDGAAELLRYGADDCVLHLILYRAADDTPPRVAHVEARDDRLDPVPEQPCIESLARGHHDLPTS